MKSLCVLMIWVSVIVLQQSGFGSDYKITKLTDNLIDDYRVQICENNIVWNTIHNGRYGLYLFNGSSTLQLGGDSLYDFDQSITSNNLLAWHAHDGEDLEIYRYQNGLISRFTNNNVSDNGVDIDGNKMVWMRDDGSSSHWQVYYYDGSSTTQLTNNTSTNRFAGISGDNIVWWTDNNIYLYNGAIHQITNSSTTKGVPYISGDNIIWPEYDGNDYEMFLYNGKQIIQLTNNIYDDNTPAYFEFIDGDKAVWHGYDGNDLEIFLFNGATVEQLTDNDSDDSHPSISGDNIVWQGFDGNDEEVFVYRNSQITQVTDNLYNDRRARIWGDTIAWQGFDGNDYEIFYAKPDVSVIPEPSTLCLFGFGLFGLAIKRKAHRK